MRLLAVLLVRFFVHRRSTQDFGTERGLPLARAVELA